MELSKVIKKVENGKRLSLEDGMVLYQCKDLPLLSMLSSHIRYQHRSESIVTYIIDRNINYTNFCVDLCSFCGFYRKLGDEEGYVLSNDEIDMKIMELIDLGGVQILMQGGLNPSLKMDYYIGLLNHIKTKFPQIHIHAFSPPEISYIAKITKIPLRETIEQLKAAGLDSIPGGGGEILVDRVRTKISRGKCDSALWLEVMQTAHEIGLSTTATMMYGHVETLEERLIHMIIIRDLQDRTGGFRAFIPWNFQPHNVPLGKDPEVNLTTHFEYLETLAISRIMIDNVMNFQASWVTQGESVAQIALQYGANDFGSLMIEENVVSQAGTNFEMTVESIEKHIVDAGFIPKRRNNYYTVLN